MWCGVLQVGAWLQRVPRAALRAERSFALSSNQRKKRGKHLRAQDNPDVHPGTLRKLREKAALPTFDTLRYLAENKVGKVVTQADRRELWYKLRYKRYAPSFIGQMKPRMNFWVAALEESQLPLPRLPEVAFAGRSNSGKSTLVNYLCGRHSAHVKREPGSTRELVFWQIGRPAQLCLVDLPGYGFAYAPQETRLQWTEFTLWYVRSRGNLKLLLLLIDANAGLKPTDREMIAYLERHHIKWRLVVTKCDRVRGKDLARKVTIMEEDVSSYKSMAGPPIPISALKMQGMEALREVLNEHKVQKEVIKDGIRIQIYDLLEQRRINRAEKRKRRKEKKQAATEEEEAREKAETHAQSLREGADGKPTTQVETERDEDLHVELDEKLSRQAEPSKPPTSTLHYKLDDRDSKRVDTFIKELYPDLFGTPTAPEQASVGSSNSYRDRVTSSESLFPTLPSAPASVWQVPAQRHSAEEDIDIGVQGTHLDDDSDDDIWDSAIARPKVFTFEPKHYHKRERPEQAAYSSSGRPSLFPKLPGTRTPADREPLGQGRERMGLLRRAGSQDQVYTQDDFASEADRSYGKRRSAPPAPTSESAGQLMASARRAYEREWLTELENVEESKQSAATPASQLRPRSTKQLARQLAPQGRGPLITRRGDRPIPKGPAKWKYLGRPPARILKKKKEPDIAKVFHAKDRRSASRKRNVGAGLEWKDAKDHWMRWFQRNKAARRFHRITEAESPRKEHVQQRFEEHKARRQGEFSRRRREKHGSEGFGPGGSQSPET